MSMVARRVGGVARYDVNHAEEVLMPWPKNHKARTRSDIVRAAAAAFRARGLAGVRLDELMASTGRTHGGFYAHFSSKEDLLAAALELASQQTIDALSRTLEALPAAQRLQAVIDTYLSPEHAAHPERGCPVAALGSELGRAGARTRRHIARSVRRRLEWLHGLESAGNGSRVADDQVIGALACMVGGLIVARLIGGKDSDVVLRACREFLHRAIDKAPRPPHSPQGVASQRKRSKGVRRSRG